MNQYSYKIYLDIFFLKNYGICLLLLFSYLIGQKSTSSIKQRIRRYWKRILGSGLLWAGVVTSTLFLPNEIRFPVGVLCELTCLFLILRKFTKNHKNTALFVATILLMTLYYAGGIGFLSSFRDSNRVLSSMLWFGSLGILLVGTFYTYYKRERTYEVTMQYGNQIVEVEALVDSGNALREPITGKAVSVMERTLLDKIEEQNGFFLIPYHSVGKESGLLQGVMVHNVKIRNSNMSINIKDMMIALCNDRLSAKGEYQMLLHMEYLED